MCNKNYLYFSRYSLTHDKKNTRVGYNMINIKKKLSFYTSPYYWRQSEDNDVPVYRGRLWMDYALLYLFGMQLQKKKRIKYIIFPGRLARLRIYCLTRCNFNSCKIFQKLSAKGLVKRRISDRLHFGRFWI